MPGNTVVGKDVVFISQDFLASYFDITTQTISNWFNPKRGCYAMPEPIYVHHQPGKGPTKIWTVSQLPAWDRWYERHLAETGKHITKRNRKTAMTIREAKETIAA